MWTTNQSGITSISYYNWAGLSVMALSLFSRAPGASMAEQITTRGASDADYQGSLGDLEGWAGAGAGGSILPYSGDDPF